MEDLVAPFLSGCAEMEDRQPFRCLQAEFAIHGFRRFDRGKGNLQAKLAAEENLASFEQGLSFCLLFPDPPLAPLLVSHGVSPLFPPIFSRSVTLRRSVSPADGPHDSK